MVCGDYPDAHMELLQKNEKLEISNQKLIFHNIEKEKKHVELVRSQNENDILGKQLNHMQKVESIGRLTAGIAHDFNNILACILGYNEMNKDACEDINDEVLKIEMKNNIKQINFAGLRATDLINKMLIYCRQGSVKQGITIKPTQEVINEVLEMLRPALTSRIEISFANPYNINRNDCSTCDITNSCEIAIAIDAIDLHQILTNLAVNARDAMKERGGIITFTLNKITNVQAICLACSEILEGNFIELSVEDNGTGIKSEIINSLFDPFFTTKPQGEGTGLGLSAVSGLVHQSGGHILVDSNQSELNHGTTFRLLFPVMK